MSAKGTTWSKADRLKKLQPKEPDVPKWATELINLLSAEITRLTQENERLNSLTNTGNNEQ